MRMIPRGRPTGLRHTWWCLVALAIGLACGRPKTTVERDNIGLQVSLTKTDCYDSNQDADSDGLDDRCELELAAAFAPELVIDPNDCLWHAEASPPRLRGGYLFAAQPLGAIVRIAFLPAYHRDCGWSGVACAMRAGRCGSHSGDSELILVDVAPLGTNRWRTTAVFLSAHCFGNSAGRCRWYRAENLSSFDWIDARSFGAPRVWVATGKHANYPTSRSCDAGHWFLDSCDHNSLRVRFPVLTSRQNIGSRARPLPEPDGCMDSDNLPLGAEGVDRGSRECVWNGSQPFRGWQTSNHGNSPTAYARYLTRIAGF